MRPGPRASCIALMALVSGLATLGTAWSAPGVVLSSSKISSTVGGFAGPLHNLDEFGGAVAWLGDLDGPGPSVAAVAVGAALDDDGSGDRGAVWILFLNASGTVLSSTKISDLVNLPGQPLDGLDQFGSSLAWLGDLDGEGPSAAALAVGSPFDDDGGTDRGAVYILFLSTSGTVLTVQKISALQGNFAGALDNLDEFGDSVANLGDLDCNGPSARAIAVGAGGDDDGGTDRGAVWILFLGTDGTVMSFSKISSTQGNFAGPIHNTDDFGGAVASLGDLDVEGPSTLALAVGATFDDDGGIDRGAVWVLFLSTTGTVMSQQKISDTQGNFNDFLSDTDEFGGALALVPDLDGVGVKSYVTLAVGIAADDDGGEDRGALQMLFLNTNGTCLGNQKISDFFGGFSPPLHNLDAFGSSVCFLGDLNGPTNPPGIATAVTGLTGDDDGPTGATDRGAIYLLQLDGVPFAGIGPQSGPALAMLGRATPNPAHPGTRIPFRLEQEADVSLAVWDLSGRLVRQLVSGVRPAGSHAVDWDGRDDHGRDLPTGTYFYRLDIDGRPATRAQKAMVLR
jgi:hypothetical protein